MRNNRGEEEDNTERNTKGVPGSERAGWRRHLCYRIVLKCPMGEACLASSWIQRYIHHFECIFPTERPASLPPIRGHMQACTDMNITVHLSSAAWSKAQVDLDYYPNL